MATVLMVHSGEGPFVSLNAYTYIKQSIFFTIRHHAQARTDRDYNQHVSIAYVLLFYRREVLRVPYPSRARIMSVHQEVTSRSLWGIKCRYVNPVPTGGVNDW